MGAWGPGRGDAAGGDHRLRPGRLKLRPIAVIWPPVHPWTWRLRRGHEAKVNKVGGVCPGVSRPSGEHDRTAGYDRDVAQAKRGMTLVQNVSIDCISFASGISAL